MTRHWSGAPPAKNELFMQYLARVIVPAQPHALVAAENAVACAGDVGRRYQHHATALGHDAIKRTIALVGDVDDFSRNGMRRVRAVGGKPDLLRTECHPAVGGNFE